MRFGIGKCSLAVVIMAGLVVAAILGYWGFWFQDYLERVKEARKLAEEARKLTRIQHAQKQINERLRLENGITQFCNLHGEIYRQQGRHISFYRYFGLGRSATEREITRARMERKLSGADSATLQDCLTGPGLDGLRKGMDAPTLHDGHRCSNHIVGSLMRRLDLANGLFLLLDDPLWREKYDRFELLFTNVERWSAEREIYQQDNSASQWTLHEIELRSIMAYEQLEVDLREMCQWREDHVPLIEAN